MCDVCSRKGLTAELIKPFLRDGVDLKFITKSMGYPCDRIRISDNENSVDIIADGDEGGYFHFKVQQ